MNKKAQVWVILITLMVFAIPFIIYFMMPITEKVTQNLFENPCLNNDGIYPNFKCTSGANITVSLEELCTVGYTDTVRNVSAQTRREVLKKYNVSDGYGRNAQIDHYIPLCLGGSNDAENLWLEPSSTRKSDGFAMGYQRKDVVERMLCKKVCAGEISLEEAQYQIVHNWTGWVGK